ncbi:MAG: DUF1501 domain-containing protein [Pirellulales bacterium]
MSNFSRRRFLQTSAAALGASSCPWLPQIAQAAASNSEKRKHCIVLWMSGGPTQTDTFDMKPEHANGGSFKPIKTKVPGIEFSEHLPMLAKQANNLAIVRGMNTTEGDHSRGTFLMHTGQRPGSPLLYPTIGSLLSKELGSDDADLPNFVSVNPYEAINQAAFSPGFLGPRYAAATVGSRNNIVPNPEEDAGDNDEGGFAELGVDFLSLPDGVSQEQADARLRLWEMQQKSFLNARSAETANAQDTIFRRAVRIMNKDAASAFDLSQETDKVRESYGKGRFGQGCLVARRLIQRGVPFIEVTHGAGGLGWDTHQNNFNTVENLSKELDQGWATLMRELEEEGLLESTTILWMGEFGRTPNINNNTGRDHFPNAWSCVLGGGGIAGGQAYGATSEDGMEVTDGKVEVGDLISTLCQAVGVDPEKENISSLARPIKISEGAAVEELLS